MANQPDWPLANAATPGITVMAESGASAQLISRPSSIKAKKASWLTPTCLAPARMRTGGPRPIQP